MPTTPTTGRKPCRRCRLGKFAIALALQVVGSSLVGFGMSRALVPRPAPQATAYLQPGGCGGCPGNVRFSALRVEKRPGSTLFVVAGVWPPTVDALPGDMRLVANDVEVVLRPHADPKGFELVQAKRAAAALPEGSLAASLTGNLFLLDLKDPVLIPPVSFELGLWKGTTYLGRMPESGRLVWDGKHAPKLVGAAAGAPPSAPAFDVTRLAGTCARFPIGRVAPYLDLGAVAAGSGPDPRTGVPTRWVGATSSVRRAADSEASPPFSFTAVVLQAGRPAGTGPRPIDRAGNLQLWLYSDGPRRYKAIRTWEGSRWTVALDSAAEPMTYVLKPDGVTWYTDRLGPGDRFGFVSADAGGCASVDLLWPQLLPEARTQ